MQFNGERRESLLPDTRQATGGEFSEPQGRGGHCVRGEDREFFQKTLKGPEVTILLRFQVRRAPHLSVCVPYSAPHANTPAKFPVPPGTSRSLEDLRPRKRLLLSTPGHEISSPSFSFFHSNSCSAAMQITGKCRRKIRLTELIHSKV